MEQEGSEELHAAEREAAALARVKRELADAFSEATFGLVEHNCSCPSAKFVRLLVKYRKDMFKGGEASAESHDITPY